MQLPSNYQISHCISSRLKIPLHLMPPRHDLIIKLFDLLSCEIRRCYLPLSPLVIALTGFAVWSIQSTIVLIVSSLAYLWVLYVSFFAQQAL